ncbi:MAG TPA: hypothetical protein VH518_16115 [Tepidisphaeraceae bacterium]
MISGTPSDWHDATDISYAKEDQYAFKPADNSASADVVEAQVKGADGKYTRAVVIGDATNYWERMRTGGSPHDCIGKAVQIKWCDPRPRVHSKVCQDTNYCFRCENKNDYYIVGVHFAAGTVSQVKISLDYAQVKLSNSPLKSDSLLRCAKVTDDSSCPNEGKFTENELLDESYQPPNIECFPQSHVATPGNKDVALYYMIKRKTWPAPLDVNNVHIETMMARN